MREHDTPTFITHARARDRTRLLDGGVAELRLTMMSVRDVVSILLLAVTCNIAQSTGGSSISFSPIPSIPEPVSEAEDTSRGLGAFYDLASGLVNAIRPGELPHDTVERLVGVINDQLQLNWEGIPPPETDIQGVTKEFLRWLAPTIIAMIIGVILAVVMPIMGCCIFCCRKSGHCGAKSRIYRKKNQNIKCFIYTTCFLLTTVMILIGAILSATSVKHTSDSLGELESKINRALDDYSNYLEGGGKQVDYIAEDQLNILEDFVLNDIEHIGEWFQENLGSDFQSDASSVVDSASLLLTVLIRIHNLTTSGNALLGNLRNLTSEIIIRVSTLRDDITNLTDICTALGTNQCDFLSSLNLAVSINYTNIGDVELNDEIDFKKVEEQVRNATDIFGDIAHFIDTEADNYQLHDRVETEFDDAYYTLRYDYLDSINDSIYEGVREGGEIDTARSKVHSALKYVDTYKPIWDGVSLALVSIFFLIVTFFAIGSFCGSFGYSRVVQPHSRSSVSHCGGRCILIGVVIAFATSPVLLVVTSMTYGLGTGVQKLCSDIEPPDYPALREVADNPEVWGGVTLIGVLTRENFDDTVNISITKTLSGCAQNEPLWKAIGGEQFITVDYDDAFDCNSLGIGSDDFLPFNGYNSDDIFPSLEEVVEFFNRINFTEYENISNETAILSFNITELQANLTDLISNMVNTTIEPLAMEILNNLNDIEIHLNTLRGLQTSVEGNITELKDLVTSSEDQLDTFSDMLESFLDELPDVVNITTTKYIARLCEYINDYITYANDSIVNDLGRCGVVSATYDALYSTVCDNTLDGFNGYWLGVGWSMLFTTVAVVIGIIISDYFRRAGTRVVRCMGTTSSESTSLIPGNSGEYDEDGYDDVSLIRMHSNHHTSTLKEDALPEERKPLHTTQMDLEW